MRSLESSETPVLCRGCTKLCKVGLNVGQCSNLYVISQNPLYLLQLATCFGTYFIVIRPLH